MLETEFNISKLIAAYLQGTITPAEMELLSQWLAENPAHKQHFEETYHVDVLKDKLQSFERADRDAIWNNTIRRMHDADMSFLEKKSRKMRYWLVAAAAVIFVGISSYLLQYQVKRPVASQQNAVKQDVAPGTSGATLTLANGKQISLSEMNTDSVTEETGVSITKSANGELIYELKGDDDNSDGENTLTTTNGQTYQIRLPDGSKVWLNAGSSLTYTPRLIKGGKRYVELSGEAYFEVTKNKHKPFVVQTKQQEIEVLGTEFNINAYQNEAFTRTTLLEGSIKVRTNKGEKLVKPGQQATTDGNDIQVKEVDVENIIDWKRGDFYLNHVSFKEGMRKIARWYNVEIIYGPGVPDDMVTGGWIARDKLLSQVLKSIESSGMVKFRVDGHKIYVDRPTQ